MSDDNQVTTAEATMRPHWGQEEIVRVPQQ